MVVDDTNKRVVFNTVIEGEFSQKMAFLLSTYSMKVGIDVKNLSVYVSLDTEAEIKVQTKAYELLRFAKVISTDRDLTRRERQVATLLINEPGITNKEIANKLNIAERTVKFHISSLIDKYKVQTRHHLPGLILQFGGEKFPSHV